MNRIDELYYNIKELNQQLDYYQNKASHKVRGAKVKVRNLKTKISDAHSEFVSLTLKEERNSSDVKFTTWSHGY